MATCGPASLIVGMLLLLISFVFCLALDYRHV